MDFEIYEKMNGKNTSGAIAMKKVGSAPAYRDTVALYTQLENEL